MPEPTPGGPADLLRRAPAATLTSLSRRHPGWPAASFVPYALAADGAPLLLLSEIAEHTRNLDADGRCCFFVAEAPGEDVRQTPRLALYGTARRLPAAEAAVARDLYLKRHPTVAPLMDLDFRLWKLEVAEAQWVGGFAAATWLKPEQLRDG